MNRFARPSRPRPAAGRLCVELLEDRLVPAAFAPQQVFATGTQPYDVAVADFNGDGLPDLAVTNYANDTVSVLLNTTPAGAATASFAAPQTFAVGVEPEDVAVGDFNGDGLPDLAVTNSGDDTVSVLLNATPAGAAAASFVAQQTFATGAAPAGVVVGDFNNDGAPDIAVANVDDGTVTLLLREPNPTATTVNFFTRTLTLNSGSPSALAVGDFNSDGRADLAVAIINGATMSVLLNTTPAGGFASSFAAAQNFAVGVAPFSATAADFNGDGLPDVATANYAAGTVSVLLNTTPAGAATASFAAAQNFAVGINPAGTAVADFNGDGLPDLVVANNGDNTVSVLLNATPAGATTASFAAAQTFAVGTNPAGPAVADFNGDGLPDLVVANNGDNTVSVLLNATPATPALTTPVELVTTTGGDLYRIDASGIHFVFGGIVAGASIAYEPTGEVMLVTTTSHDLYRIDSSGIHFVFGGIVAGASLAYEDGTEVMLVTTTGHDLYRIDANGIQFMYGGIVAGASIAYEDGAEVMLVTTTGRDLYQVDGNGITFLFGGIVADASVAEGPSGQEELITTTGGDLYQVDASGITFKFGGIIAGSSLTYEP